MVWAIIILGAITVLLLGLVAWLAWKYGDLSRRYDRDIKAARTDSVKQSRAVQLGGIAQQIAPLLPGFPYDPKDCRWAGQPIDMIVFDGLEAGGDVNVVFLEVKTAGSHRNRNQRRVKAAVDAGRVEFAEYRPGLAPPLEMPEPEFVLPPEHGRPGEDGEEEPDFSAVDLREIGQALPHEGWEDAVIDVTVADDPLPGQGQEPAGR